MEPQLCQSLTQEQLIKMGTQLKRQYFPNWDLNDEWKFELVADLNGALGKADIKSRVIKILEQVHQNLAPLLIHEMCHAVFGKRGQGHGKIWINRMVKAAKDAKKFGDKVVAEAINKEAQGYSDAPKLYKRQCYQELEDITIELCRQSSNLEELLGKYEVAEEFVRRDHGLRREEFREWLPKARRVFEKEARDAWKMHEIYQRVTPR